MRKISDSTLYILILIITFVLVSSMYFKKQYSNINVDEMLFYLSNGLDGASFDAIYQGIIDNIVNLLLLLFILSIPLFSTNGYHFYLEYRYKNFKQQIQLYPFGYKIKFIYIFILILGTSFYAIKAFKINEYILAQQEYSLFIEENYVNPSNVEIRFPEEKRNLIIIYLESFETTMMSQENGGAWKVSVTPELEQLGIENLNFSNTSILGGAIPTNGTKWTIAGLVASTAGIPLKIPPALANSYTTENSFLNGAITLGDILKEEGYKTKIMFGSDAKFGGREAYFKVHGDYDIFDLHSAINSGKMDESETVFWGFEDKKLFEWAKEEIVKLSRDGKPFNFNLLTVDTHFPDGYLEKDTPKSFPTQYENVFAQSSREVALFLEWLEEQEFYKDTTIVLLGDHNSMQEETYYTERISDDFTRVTFNTFINAVKEPINEKNRLFSTIDMYPTILSSIGVDIIGNKLGLGVDLFSNSPTLFEQYGVEYTNLELQKNSLFYNREFLGDDFIILQKSLSIE